MATDLEDEDTLRAFYSACVQKYQELSFVSDDIDLGNTHTLWTLKSVPVDRAAVFWDEYEVEVSYNKVNC
jgi:hypothetical protein